ncbi:unnamed protein product [Sphagnum balticum]
MLTGFTSVPEFGSSEIMPPLPAPPPPPPWLALFVPPPPLLLLLALTMPALDIRVFTTLTAQSLNVANEISCKNRLSQICVNNSR